MKVAVAIAEFLRDAGIRHVFTISGGADLHIIHAIADTQGIDYVCPQTEQAASFAADAYARVNGIGCALATSGPGATNLVTGIAASYYDSVPVLYLTGNVTTFRMAARLCPANAPRQYGFQETPIVAMVREVTKHAEMVLTPGRVLPALRDAVRIMRFNRPGPVLVDVPDDVQRADL